MTVRALTSINEFLWPVLTGTLALLTLLLPSALTRTPLLAQTISDPEQQFKEAQAAIERGDYPTAINLLEKLVEQYPDNHIVHFQLAYAYTMSNQWQPAEEHYRKALEIEPQFYEATLNLGLLLARQQHYQEAFTFLEKAKNLRPQAYEPYYHLGQVCEALQRWQCAEDAFKTALKLRPHDPVLHFRLGEVYISESKLNDGLSTLEEALKLDPDLQAHVLRLAQQWDEKGDSKVAVALYRLVKHDPGARRRLAEILLETLQPAEAINELKVLTRESPSAELYQLLALAFLKAEQSEDALQALDAAIRLDPSNANLYLIRGRIQRDLRNFQAAAKDFLAAAQRMPQQVEVWSELAGVLVLLENYPQALAAINQIEKLGGLKPGHLFMRALAYDHMKQYELALRDYQQFLEQSDGKFPREEFQAKQRIKVLERLIKR